MEYKIIKNFPSINRNYVIGDIIDHNHIIYSKCKDWPEFFDPIEDDYEIIKQKGDDIISVRRKSDNRIFTLGDRVRHPNNGNGIIQKIILCTNPDSQVVAALGDKNSIGKLFLGINNTNGNCLLKNAIKAEPLFTTEDGVDIYEGDLYYRLYDNFTMSRFKAINPQYGVSINFYSKEAAEKYVEENKPMYSLNDIKKALNKSFDKLSFSYSLKNNKNIKNNL